MKRWTLIVVALLLVAVPFALAACGEEEEAAADASPSPVAPTADIVDTAAAAGDFTTLLAAIDAAGLTETLKGTGPFTVFAPTDAAFEALPAGTLDELLADPTGDLTDILLYHVVPEEGLMKADLEAGGKFGTALEDESLVTYTGSDGKVYVNDIEIVTFDVQATNGVIHVVDAVILP
jgi:uncharacterized surface protein with fasciclin (FAS1) repeats